ncbi:MAG: ABC transporter permease subunit [Rectinema sp.]|nr:ABC transporter permease subunit [Rectinema sp.]
MSKGITRKGQVILLVLFGFISLLPVIAIVLDAVRAGLSLNASALLPPGFTWYFLRVTAQTLFLCLVTVIISLLIGLPSAQFLARIPSSHALLFTMMLSVPLASPSLVSAVMIRTLFEKSSWLVKALGSVGIRLPSVYGFWGLLLALLLHTIPYTILILRSGFLIIPRTLSETAFSLGAERRTAFRSVLVPYIMPQVYTAILMMIIYIMGDLGAPLILGGGYKVFASEIYTNFISNWGDKRIPLVFALWSIVVFSLVLLVLVQIQRLTAERTSRGEQGSREDHSTAHTWAYVLQWILNIGLLTPFLTALGKYLPLVRMNPRESIHDFTPVRNTFLLVLFSVPLMITGALAIAHILKTTRNKSLYTAVILAPAVVPGVILGFGLLKVLYAIPPYKIGLPGLWEYLFWPWRFADFPISSS